MLQHIGQRIVVVFHHLLGFVARLLILANEIGCLLPTGKRALDHAGIDCFIHNGVLKQRVKFGAGKSNIPTSQFRNGVALLFDAAGQNKPERLSILSQQRKLLTALAPFLFKLRPKLLNGNADRQAMDDFLPGKIAFHKLSDQRFHCA